MGRALGAREPFLNSSTPSCGKKLTPLRSTVVRVKLYHLRK